LENLANVQQWDRNGGKRKKRIREIGEESGSRIEKKGGLSDLSMEFFPIQKSLSGKEQQEKERKRG
jgi:hypothetical protein